MSEVRVNNIVDYGGKGAPTFDNGAVISGVSSLGNQAKIGSNVTITSGGINVSGVTTAVTLSGILTGDVNTGFVTATSAVIGSGVTNNAGGLNITGVVTATTFEGDGSTMTGVAMTIAPLAYNPDVNDSVVATTSGIGITFDHRILAGSGNVTLSVANAGVAGTVVENFGVGSSVTIQGRKAIISPSSALTNGETYHISYPSGAFTNTGGDVDYVGTAYTFGVIPQFIEMWVWGVNQYGQLGLNQRTPNDETGQSSPTQLPGTNWSTGSPNRTKLFGTKADGTLWGMGSNSPGGLCQNNRTQYSSPVQIPGTTWNGVYSANYGMIATKTDGTLWAAGYGAKGLPGQNNNTSYSSPVQIPGTNWAVAHGGINHMLASKTDGTLWVWGDGGNGVLGLNDGSEYSSPKQIPGTTWGQTRDTLTAGAKGSAAIKTDGTLWTWGKNEYGQLGINDRTTYSSPKQVPGTDWRCVYSTYGATNHAIKTDGTLWAWGWNFRGWLGQNQHGPTGNRSSPVQIPGTTWDKVRGGDGFTMATKTDGTLWFWGQNGTIGGTAGQNTNIESYSSPVQIPGTDWSLDDISMGAPKSNMALKVL